MRQREALIRLTAKQLRDCDKLPQLIAELLEECAATLNVARVSFWRFDDARTAIDCIDLYDASAGAHSSGSRLLESDYPAYFQSISDSDFVDADDAWTDPRTREFTERYLKPYDIRSMLDAPAHLDGEVAGVLCHEHVGDVRRWTDDERGFVVAAANLISLALERCERHRTESMLLLQSAALNAVADAMIIADRQGLILWANPAFEALTGFPAAEVAGRDFREAFPSGIAAQPFFDDLVTTVTSGRVWRGEFTNRRKDGSAYIEDQSITPVLNADGVITHFVAVKRDQTVSRELERKFLQAQKMEIVGRLAGGIAHDFNNLLTVINGTAEMAMMDLPSAHPLYRDLERIGDSGKRASAMTRQLLTFSRKEVTKRDPLDPGRLLLNFRNMLQRLIGEDIALTVKAGEPIGHVLADPSQLEQVILNLAVNARDAMPKGGRLTIEAHDVDLDAAFAARHDGVRPGPHVMLAVTDTGIGMPPEILARLFEPFFTTKPSGKGTGLGLATVFTIVEQSEGTVWAYSEPGHGTTFKIYLPRVAPGDAGVPPPGPAVARGTETVLVVEDEDDVRELTTHILESAGYDVLAAGHGAAALQTLRLHEGQIDLMVTDVVLPGMGGRELASRAAAVRPDLPVLYTSGYTDDTVLAHGVRDSTAHFIAKPYAVSALTHKVREVIDASSGHRRGTQA